MKKIFDIVVSIIILLLLSPLLLIVTILIMIDDHGSPFFVQRRVGFMGKEFGMYKFRSMKINSDKDGPYFTQHNDPRITRIGRFLRRSSIDELPQLLNVIFGDMSIVGPRPDLPVQKSLYSELDWNKRHSVKPGITGLAQATVRSDSTHEKRLELDLEYVNNHNFLYDLKIVCLTVKQLIIKGGN
ncbi:sugar transferase [Vibrio cholerae]|uniref:sugar transferase n=1 Tax=Vibrio cholerae TaxID=666 RepID=UPI00053C0CF4|nr:sugar transferase [Vibrio cholerae]EJL6467417.1 sugar transferase [Vibrio cholerae]EKF9298849.1 sugar transferase [Vibrio cholerae]EKF9936914.1 sugar transferase [Vibrio cholerae]EMC2457675.1 sugar transferase [Vibrio cholerae]PAS37497.1 sugar transferase [Vibrio cholerae]